MAAAGRALVLLFIAHGSCRVWCQSSPPQKLDAKLSEIAPRAKSSDQLDLIYDCAKRLWGEISKAASLVDLREEIPIAAKLNDLY